MHKKNGKQTDLIHDEHAPLSLAPEAEDVAVDTLRKLAHRPLAADRLRSGLCAPGADAHLLDEPYRQRRNRACPARASDAGCVEGCGGGLAPEFGNPFDKVKEMLGMEDEEPPAPEPEEPAPAEEAPEEPAPEA